MVRAETGHCSQGIPAEVILDPDSDGGIAGKVRFHGMEFLVGLAVFTPQPETGALVDWVLANANLEPAPVVVDLCSGCGTIALALSCGLDPGAQVHAVERSPEAFCWLERNVTAYGGRVQAHLEDACDALHGLDGGCHLVVSNPPYVADSELHCVPPEVLAHDPRSALFAGSDGMDVIRIVERAAWRLLVPGGLVVIEHSDRQGEVAPAFLREQGWHEVADHADHQGRDRFVTARRPHE